MKKVLLISKIYYMEKGRTRKKLNKPTEKQLSLAREKATITETSLRKTCCRAGLILPTLKSVKSRKRQTVILIYRI